MKQLLFAAQNLSGKVKMTVIFILNFLGANKRSIEQSYIVSYNIKHTNNKKTQNNKTNTIKWIVLTLKIGLISHICKSVFMHQLLKNINSK